MRMAAGLGVTAADVLNTWTAERLADAFADLADERHARRLGRVIVKRRATAAFATSDDLVGAIREALGPRSGPSDFARLFQALRIVVNQELEQLDLALPALRAALVAGGRLAVITYHSGEDRIVKHAFRDWSKSCVCPPRQPVCTCRGRPLGRVLTRKGIAAAATELADNPRARSARLRAFEVADHG
jgi:16S rRNA (cytosine1402-N4)-methyltransferase